MIILAEEIRLKLGLSGETKHELKSR